MHRLKGISTVFCLLLLFSTVVSTITTIDVWFLGVEDSNPSVGIAIKSYIKIYNSSSYRIFIHNANYDKSVLYSFLLASYAMRYVCNVDIDNIAVDVYIDNSYRQIKGSSASLAYTIAILKALNKTNLLNIRWGATGVVSIDGFIDAAGGLTTKIKAAKENSVKTIYIPTINGLLEAVDGSTIKIISITSLADICGGPLHNNTSIEPPLESLTIVNTFFEHRAIEFLNRAKELVDRFPIEMKNSTLSLYRNLSVNVEKALKRRHGYTAANYAFLGYMQLLHEYLTLNTTIYNYLIEESENSIKNALGEFNSFRYIYPSTIPLLVVVLDRISEAQFYIDLYRNLTRASTLSSQKALEILTRAYARSLTIDIWLDLLKLVNNTIATNSGYKQFIAFNKTYATTLNVLKITSLIIEWNEKFAPLSLSAIASTRNTLAKQLNDTLRLKITDALKKLYRIHSVYLDDNAKIVPYLYYIYAEDLEIDGSSDYINMLSMSTLIASTSNIIRYALDRGMPSTYTLPKETLLPYDIKTVTLLLSIITIILLLALLLHIVEKGFRFSSIAS